MCDKGDVMSLDPTELVRARLRSIKTILERVSEKTKRSPIDIGLADNFNAILREVEILFPQLKQALPAQISTQGEFSSLGLAAASYLGLEVFAEQVLSLLEVAQKKP
jgi:hypothetical protein